MTNCYRNSVTKTNRNKNVNKYNFRYISVPYIRGASERVDKIIRAHGIKLGHKQSSICIMYSKRQTRGYGQEWRDILIKCNDCQAEYIGETGKE